MTIAARSTTTAHAHVARSNVRRSSTRVGSVSTIDFSNGIRGCFSCFSRSNAGRFNRVAQFFWGSRADHDVIELGQVHSHALLSRHEERFAYAALEDRHTAAHARGEIDVTHAINRNRSSPDAETEQRESQL